MTRQIRKIGVALMACFLLLFVQLNRLTVFQAAELNDNPVNTREILRGYGDAIRWEHHPINIGLARAINPVHTLSDGDTLFALATGASGRSLGMMTLGAMAAEACALAVVRAIRAARGLAVDDLHLPAAGELP